MTFKLPNQIHEHENIYVHTHMFIRGCYLFDIDNSRSRESCSMLDSTQSLPQISDLQMKSVRPSTLKLHKKNWIRWLRFIEDQKCEVYLHGLAPRDKVLTAIQYIHHLQATGLRHDQIGRMISSCKFMFRVEVWDTGFFEDPSLKMALQSTRQIGRHTNPLIQNPPRLSSTLDLIAWLRRNNWKTVDERMTTLGITLGFHFLLRISEYTWSRDNTHCILCSDLVFILNDNKVCARKDLVQLNGSIKKLIVYQPSTKTDQSGAGSLRMLQRTKPQESQLLTDITNWLIESGTKPEEPLFSRYKDGRHLKLTPHMVNDTLKKAGRALGLDPSRISSHSLRIGGASSLKQSGYQRVTIKELGLWSEKSSLDLLYTQSISSSGGVLSLIDEESSLNSSDVKISQDISRKRIRKR